MITVLCHGVFDLLHLGHIRHLHEAKAFGDWLVVSLTADQHVNKGTGRPQFTAQQRKEALLALACVDEVVINDSDSAIKTIQELSPAVYVKGCDYQDSDDPVLQQEIAAIQAVGGRFCTTSGQKWSSTGLLRNLRLSDEALAYLERARERSFLPDILAAFERADKLKIAFVGETIKDIYNFVGTLGRPSKEPIVATEVRRREDFSGGVVAASKHAEWPVLRVVTPQEMVYKTRWVHNETGKKLFEVYESAQLRLSEERIAKFDRDVEDAEKWANVFIVFDFGHGLMDHYSDTEFMAATAQTNAGNYGFNSVEKYKGANYICVDEAEARLATQRQRGPIEDVARAMRGWARKVVITRNSHGSLVVNGDPPTAVPAFIHGGVDTMGAGDAFLACTAPLVAAGLPLEQAAFVGNVAGGLKTGILGHREHVTRQDLVKNIEWLLK